MSPPTPAPAITCGIDLGYGGASSSLGLPRLRPPVLRQLHLPQHLPAPLSSASPEFAILASSGSFSTSIASGELQPARARPTERRQRQS